MSADSDRDRDADSDTDSGNGNGTGIFMRHRVRHGPVKGCLQICHEYPGYSLTALLGLMIEAWTKTGLGTYYLLFVMEAATRRVYFAGCTANPDELRTVQTARNLSDSEDGFLHRKKFPRSGSFHHTRCGSPRTPAATLFPSRKIRISIQ